MTNSQLKRLQISVTEEQKEHLRDLAYKERISEAEIVRRAIDGWVKKLKQAADKAVRD